MEEDIDIAYKFQPISDNSPTPDHPAFDKPANVGDSPGDVKVTGYTLKKDIKATQLSSMESVDVNDWYDNDDGNQLDDENKVVGVKTFPVNAEDPILHQDEDISGKKEKQKKDLPNDKQNMLKDIPSSTNMKGMKMNENLNGNIQGKGNENKDDSHRNKKTIENESLNEVFNVNKDITVKDREERNANKLPDNTKGNKIPEIAKKEKNANKLPDNTKGNKIPEIAKKEKNANKLPDNTKGKKIPVIAKKGKNANKLPDNTKGNKIPEIATKEKNANKLPDNTKGNKIPEIAKKEKNANKLPDNTKGKKIPVIAKKEKNDDKLPDNTKGDKIPVIAKKEKNANKLPDNTKGKKIPVIAKKEKNDKPAIIEIEKNDDKLPDNTKGNKIPVIAKKEKNANKLPDNTKGKKIPVIAKKEKNDDKLPDNTKGNKIPVIAKKEKNANKLPDNTKGKKIPVIAKKEKNANKLTGNTKMNTEPVIANNGKSDDKLPDNTKGKKEPTVADKKKNIKLMGEIKESNEPVTTRTNKNDIRPEKINEKPVKIPEKLKGSNQEKNRQLTKHIEDKELYDKDDRKKGHTKLNKDVAEERKERKEIENINSDSKADKIQDGRKATVNTLHETSLDDISKKITNQIDTLMTTQNHTPTHNEISRKDLNEDSEEIYKTRKRFEDFVDELTLNASDREMKRKFFETAITQRSRINTQVTEKDSSNEDEDLSEDELLENIINEVYKKIGEDSPTYVTSATDTWTLLAAGEQICKKEEANRAHTELVIIELGDEEIFDQTQDGEAWILVARGVEREVLEDGDILDDETWFSFAQGSDIYSRRENNLQKLSWWSGERDFKEEPRYLWDLDNMPIQTEEFIHFDHHFGKMVDVNSQMAFRKNTKRIF